MDLDLVPQLQLACVTSGEDGMRAVPIVGKQLLVQVTDKYNIVISI